LAGQSSSCRPGSWRQPGLDFSPHGMRLRPSAVRPAENNMDGSTARSTSTYFCLQCWNRKPWLLDDNYW
jgi:hypothetical protein